MKLRNKFLSVLLMLAMVLSLSVPAIASAEDGRLAKDLSVYAGKTVILHTNDSHGRIQFGTDSSLGFSLLATLKEALTKAGAEVILLDAGDTLHGKPIATIDKGETVVNFMNLLEYDAMTLGNHDYNYGTDRLLELVKMMKFPAVAANFVSEEDGEALVDSNVLIEKNGMTFGVFGLSTEETATKTNPNNVIGYQFIDPVATAKEQVAELEEAGADFIIALGHIGIDASSDPISADLLKEVKGIDLFIDGHSHSSLASSQALNKKLVSNGDYLKTFGCVIVDEDGAIEPISIDAASLVASGVVKPAKGKIDLVPGVDGSPDTIALAAGADETVLNKAVGKEMNKAAVRLMKELGEVVAKAPVFLDGIREHVRGGETNLGNLAADALRYATGADIAMTNGGGIRVSIEKGNITKGNLADVFPFGNIVVTKKVTGKAIKEMLEHGVKDYPELSGGFPQTSGITYTLDADKPAGKRVSDIKVAGKALKEKSEYVLASNDFTFAGGDGYEMLGAFPTLTEYGALDEVLIRYFETNPAKSSYEVGRLTIKNAATDTVPAEPVPEEPPKGESYVYTVVKGDFLQKIAKNLLGSAGKWTKIYEWNQAVIKNPDYLSIGQKLTILPE